MPDLAVKKVVYFFGAGATHAELHNWNPDLLPEEFSLLIGDVSARVIEKARQDPSYLRDVELVSSTKGSLNIELLISLLENSKVHGWENKTKQLKQLVRSDIEAILIPQRTRRFYLHKAIFEYHNLRSVERKEKLIGCISLNYDHVLDLAYKEYLGEPNYCFCLDKYTLDPKHIPLLKLHGSFNWEQQRIRGRLRTIEIIPLGSTKSYLHAPYGAIWSRALELLVECNTLRIIGCSLSQNDVHLIDLLFKAHLERREAFDLELIVTTNTGEEIRRNYGFFPNIQTLSEIEGNLIPDVDPPNPFLTWLKYKLLRMVEGKTHKTRYLKKVLQ